MDPSVDLARDGSGHFPATRSETLPTALGAVLLVFIALLVSYARGYMLLYGDAVAHLGIARRILDSRNPGITQLGGVWLPLPHLLMLPFIQKMEWWQTGLAGAWPSAGCYVVGVIGLYRLCRRMLTPQWALAATMIYAVNPNLLYLATTAMTEPLFLAELIWIALLTAECLWGIRNGLDRIVRRRLLLLGLLIVAAVYTRYDGWILGAAVWCIVAWRMLGHREVGRRTMGSFAVFTLLAVMGPLGWFAYNQHFFHDPLDFMRGPYSAAAIDRKTSPPGSAHYLGWHSPTWAIWLYTRTAQLDAAAWETGFGVMAAAIAGLVLTVRRRVELASLILWLPLPFYVYSIAFGSVPIFVPPLWPHAYYNSRYGMEMLPALALFTCIALEELVRRLVGYRPVAVRLVYPATLSLALINAVAMMYRVPLVLKEAMVNSTTRVAFEMALAGQLKSFPTGVPILMYNSDHVGALQQAAIPLKQTLNEEDYDSWMAALKKPAASAAYVVAIAGDPVSKSVAEHPENLTELTVLCTTGQPCARIYKSDEFGTTVPGRTSP